MAVFSTFGHIYSLMKEKTALVVYHSKRGKTASYARDIAMYLWTKGMNVKLMASGDYESSKIEDCDYLFLGCWTSGWFVVHQHPHRVWKEFAHRLPRPLVVQTFLFSTYQFRIGSMFRNMMRHLDLKRPCRHTIASKTGRLTFEDKQEIDRFLNNV